MSNTKKLIFSIAFIAVLIAVGISSYFIIEGAREPGASVVIFCENEIIAEYPLSTDGEYTLNNGSNILTVKDGKAYMKYADCPDGLCKHQGKISRTGERIVCLPNRIMIEVQGVGEEIFPN